MEAATGGMHNLVLVFGAMALVVAVLFALLSGRRETDAIPVKIPNLVSPAELFFFNFICEPLERHGYRVNAKVRLGDLVKFHGGSDSARWKRMQQVNRKHVDFVVCDRKSMMPIFVIELDDSSHNRRDRRHRDQLVDYFLDQAGIPIIHVRVQRRYRDELNELLLAMANGDGHSEDMARLAGCRVVS